MVRLASARLYDPKKVGRVDKWRPEIFVSRREEGRDVDVADGRSGPHSPFGDFPRSRLSTGTANHGASGVGEGWRGEVRLEGDVLLLSVIDRR